MSLPSSAGFPPKPISAPQTPAPDSPSPQADENAPTCGCPLNCHPFGTSPPASSAPAPVPTQRQQHTVGRTTGCAGEDEDTYGRVVTAGVLRGCLPVRGSRSGGVNNDEYDEDDEDYSFDDGDYSFDDEDEEQVRGKSAQQKKKGFQILAMMTIRRVGRKPERKKGDKGDGSVSTVEAGKLSLRTAVWVVLVSAKASHGVEAGSRTCETCATVVSDTVAQQVGYTGFPVAQGENVMEAFLALSGFHTREN